MHMEDLGVEKMKILVSGGGTGGHIYPALALIRGLKKKYFHLETLYVGTEEGLESSIVPKAGILFKTIKISGFRRRISFENVKTVARFLSAYQKAKKYLKEFQPDVVIGTGGYVSGPVLFAAARLKIPTVIHEQNSVPGITNIFLSKFVTKVAISFEAVSEYFPKEKLYFTGNPRASEVVRNSKGISKKRFGFQENKKLVVISGGSRGARPINDAVRMYIQLSDILDYEVLYITGDVHYDRVMEQLKNMQIPKGFKLVPYMAEMQELLTVTDLIVNRAGATTLAEITALGLPSILIPSPHVTNNHQEKNARVLEEHGACKVILESELTGEKLKQAIESLLQDEDELKRMSEGSFTLGVRDSIERFDMLIQEIKNNRGCGG